MKRLQQMAQAPSARVLPPFAPPKPTLATGLQTAFQVCDEVFSTEKYKAGMRKAFFERCQFHAGDPLPHCQSWLRFSAKRLGCLKLAFGMFQDSLSLGELASELEVETPEEDDPAMADEAGGMSSSDEEEVEEGQRPLICLGLFAKREMHELCLFRLHLCALE